MRGKRSIWLNYANAMRITPAHAGKTPTILPIVPKAPDHPRTCGENIQPCIIDSNFHGSPPHMRGKPTHGKGASIALRITPAHAGKTQNQDEDGRAKSDHPRTCGENQAILYTEKTTIGSPPHMRGKLCLSSTCYHSSRITPAHAGKTLRKCYIAEVNPHPIRQFPLTSHKVVVSSGNPTKLCVILLYQIESILLKSGVYSPVHPPAFVLQGLTCQL